MNKYEIIGNIGAGAYGIVLKCRDRWNGEIVAIKKSTASEGDEPFSRTSVREVKILRTMRHRNIVDLKEAFKRNGKLFLVFEFVDKNLLEVLREFYPSGFDPGTLKSTVFQILCGIDYCHRQNVIHRDVKPENILVNLSDMSVKICDFGFARFTGFQDRPDLTAYVATRWYRAPELLLRNASYGPAVDVFAIGCVMAELADGEPLLPGDSDLTQLLMIAQIIGPLPKDLLDRFTFNAEPSSTYTEIDDRYLTRLPLKAIRFLRRLLDVDQYTRYSARSALHDRYFEKTESKFGHLSIPPKLSYR